MKNQSLLVIAWLVAAPLVAHGQTPRKAGTIVEEIRIEGHETLSTERIRGILPFQKGDTVRPQQRELAKKMVLSLFKNSGFLEAEVNTGWKNRVFRITVREGPLYRFGETKVSGLTTLPTKIFVMERTYKEGDPYNRQELFTTQSRLYLTGLLEDIRIQSSTTSARIANVHIDVKQKKLKWIKGGVGWGSEEKERFTLIFSHDNVWHEAHKAQLLGTISRIWREYRLDYAVPYFIGTRTEQRSVFSWRSEDREGYDTERIQGSLSLSRDLNYDIKGTIGYQFNRTNTFDVDPEITTIAPDRSSGRSVILALNRDNADDPFFPANGTRTNLRLERSGGFLGGTIDFNKATLEWNAFESIWDSVIAAIAVRSGAVKEFPPSDNVPIFERLFIGGANSVRGYKERGVGPTDSLGNPLGGRWKLGSTLEIRFPLFWRFRGAVFLDGGQVGNKRSDVAVSEWRYGAGGGLRFHTPVGPIRLDYGYKLNRASNDTDPWRIHFSLGESF